jgi:hypothetical protein
MNAKRRSIDRKRKARTHSAYAKRQPGKPVAHRAPADEHAATELVLYIENTSDLSPDGPSGQGHSVLLNALRKYRKGTYDPALAVRLFEYLTEAGAKRYAKEFATEREWSTMFTPATRHEAAKQLEASFRNSAEQGEYDHVDTRIGVREENRKHSMTYGALPSFEEFEHDIHTRIDPEGDGKKPYWPPGTLYPMELVGAHEIELIEGFGATEEFEPERRRTGRHSGVRGFKYDERDMYGLLEYLVEAFNEGDEEAGDLASGIMGTLGYEWI